MVFLRAEGGGPEPEQCLIFCVCALCFGCFLALGDVIRSAHVEVEPRKINS